MECPESLRVQAYFDGEVDAVAAAAIERHLATCEQCRALLQELQEVRTLLREKVPKTGIPAQLRDRIMQSLDQEARTVVRLSDRKAPPPQRSRPFWIGVLGGVGGSAVAAAVTLLVLSPVLNQSLTAELVADHTRSLMSSHLIDVVSTDQHTVKPWFDGKLKFSPPVHDFAERGFRLTGGRLDYLNGREVAALVYQRRLHIINLFIWPSESGRNTAVENFTKDGYNVLHWDRDGFAFWAVSDVNAEDLRAFADLAM
jgi:mycothiol system anti-sigma-R factor